ncbi:MAG: restriction endonuclease subunit S [Deltaproteobacteria bacterium]|jgi:type I restriction enzyme S subunit|nr:restriction endonuclease subunit S [Deltaproteobacteria bacterium]
MKAKLLRHIILDLAIRGRLVPQDPKDEPVGLTLRLNRDENGTPIKHAQTNQVNTDYGHISTYENKLKVPFDIPDSWQWVRLGDLSEKISSGLVKAKFRSRYVPSGVPCIRALNVHNEGLTLDDLVFIDDETFKRCPRSIIRFGDILLNLVGQPLGRCAIVTNNLGKAMALNSVCIIRLKEIDFQPFIHKVLISGYMQGVIQNCKAGSIQPHISLDNLRVLLVPLPPLAEQRRIVAAIERTFRVIVQLEAARVDLLSLVSDAKRKILSLAVRGQLVPQDISDEPANVLLNRFRRKWPPRKRRKGSPGFVRSLKDHDFGHLPYEVPETWRWIRLGEICKIEGRPVLGNNIPDDAWILRMEDIDKETGKVLRVRRKYERSFTRVMNYFMKGQVLYAKFTLDLKKVIVAYENGYCPDNILPLHFCDNICPEYARFFLISDFFVTYATQCLKGTIIPALRIRDIEGAWFALPPLGEQKRIAFAVETAFTYLDQIIELLS